MPSLHSKIQIWNMSLDLLKEQPLSSIDDTTPVAKVFTRNYDQQRDYLLERYNWKFAMARENLAADPTAPAWGWTYRYALPTQSLRFYPPTIDGSWNGRPIPFEEEGGYIMCNLEAPLRLRYINRITTEGLFSNGFVELLSIRMAMRCAHWITGKVKLVENLQTLYRSTFDEVKETGAFQAVGGAYYDSDILDERGEFY